MQHLTQIETPRLLLRPFVASDAPAAFQWFGDEVVMRYTPSGPDSSLQQSTDRLASYQRHQAAHGFSKWLILDRDARLPIGDSGLLVMPDTKEIDLGIRLSQPWWGKGMATEAGQAWVRTGFGDFGLTRLTAFAHPANKASLRVLEKLGFRREGPSTVMGMQSLVFSLDASGPRGVLVGKPG